MTRLEQAPPVGFRLLHVCTGNMCRSPFAEILTRHLLIGKLGGRMAASFDVASAGVRAVVDAPMHPDTRSELTPWGLDGVAAGFSARQLRPAMIESADLVLGAAPAHRGAVLEQSPAALRKAFGLREFAWLATDVDPATLPQGPVARAHALVEHAWLNRGRIPRVGPDEYAVPDPMGRHPSAHHEAALLIFAALRTIMDRLAPPARRAR